MKNAEIFDLLSLQKSLVYFTTSLRSNEAVLQKLPRTKTLKMYEEDEELLEDVGIENKQAAEMARIYTDILTGMMDAFTSVISNNLNRVMKLLTSLTIILSIPTIVASFFGMNVKVPFQNYTHAFIADAGDFIRDLGGIRAGVLEEEVPVSQATVGPARSFGRQAANPRERAAAGPACAACGRPRGAGVSSRLSSSVTSSVSMGTTRIRLAPSSTANPAPMKTTASGPRTP